MKFLNKFLLIFFFAAPTLLGAQTNTIDSLQKVIAQGKNDIQQLKAYNKLADELLRKDLVKALKIQQQGIKLAKELNNPVQLSAGYVLMATLHGNTGNTDSSRFYMQLLKQLATATNIDTIHLHYYAAQGLELKKAGDFKNALPYLVKAEQLATKLKNRISQAGQCINIGNTYRELGNYQKSLQYQLKALRIFEQENNKRGQSFCYGNIGFVFLYLNQYKSALSYYEKSMQLKKELDDKRGMISALSGLAKAYNGLKDYEKAIKISQEALAISKELKLVKEEAGIYLDLGKFNMNKGDKTTAVDYLNLCKNAALQSNDSSMVRNVEAEMLALQTVDTNGKQLEQKFYSTLQHSLEKGDKKNEIAGYKHLSEYYASNNQFDKALEYSKKYYDSSNNVHNVDVQLQVARLESQYNLEKKEQEIAILKKDQQLQQLSLQKHQYFQYATVVVLVLLILIALLLINRNRVIQRTKRLIEIEGIRNDIARDLHDDMGSVLSSIHINSKMALYNDQSNRKVNDYLQKIHENAAQMLDSMSDIVWAINPANDTVEKVVLRMKEFAADILDPQDIGYEFMIDDDLNNVKLDAQQRKDFYLVFKEAVNNAAKYSRCKRITVRLQRTGNNIMLEVNDDGAGFNSETIKPGNGLANMLHRAKHMNGDIKINSAINEGTTITLQTISHV